MSHIIIKIVLLVTKAVGDFLGTNGIADEMIRFNGFPFLEKEDHSYNVAGKASMSFRFWGTYCITISICRDAEKYPYLNDVRNDSGRHW